MAQQHYSKKVYDRLNKTITRLKTAIERINGNFDKLKIRHKNLQ